MNQALKQRLVGTLVLGCLALIFIPLLLDGEGITPATIETTAPPAPDLSYRALPEPTPSATDTDVADPAAVESSDADALADTVATDTASLTNAAPAADTESDAGSDVEPAVDTASEANTATTSNSIALPVPADRVGTATTDTTPVRNADGLPLGWTTRVGAFSNRANAETLQACLILEGFKAYSRQQGGTEVTRVYIGPVATRAEAVALGSNVVGKCGLTENGMPLEYTP